jgi:hypothetical protein
VRREPKSLQLPSGYHELLQELKGRIRTAQVRAGLAVSRELVLLYWSIGRDLSQRFATEGWGSKINEGSLHLGQSLRRTDRFISHAKPTVRFTDGSAMSQAQRSRSSLKINRRATEAEPTFPSESGASNASAGQPSFVRFQDLSGL